MSSKVACLYIRVSTEDQTELSPDAQKRLLLDYAQKNDMIVSGDFIFTESVSGRHAQKRPEFQKMIALAKQPSHPIDVILVWKFSRFARNQEESIVYKSMLKKDNVDVISVSEPLIDGPFGSLIERIIEWMDEYYSNSMIRSIRLPKGPSISGSDTLITSTLSFLSILLYTIDSSWLRAKRLNFHTRITSMG